MAVILVKGLPNHATKEEVMKFFNNCNIQQVHFCKNRDGQPSGGAFITMETIPDVKEWLKFDRKTMGSGRVEIFQAK